MLRVRRQADSELVKDKKKTHRTGISGIGWLIMHTALLKGSKVGMKYLLRPWFSLSAKIILSILQNRHIAEHYRVRSDAT